MSSPPIFLLSRHANAPLSFHRPCSLGWRCAQEKHVDGHLCLVYVFLRSEQMGREIEQSSHFRREKRARAGQRTPELNQIQDLLTVTSKGICTNRSQIRHGIRPEGPGAFHSDTLISVQLCFSLLLQCS
jgi:hypothetical protein